VSGLRKVTPGGRVWYVCPLNEDQNPPILLRAVKPVAVIRRGTSVAVNLMWLRNRRWSHHCPVCRTYFLLLGSREPLPEEFHEIPVLQAM